MGVNCLVGPGGPRDIGRWRAVCLPASSTVWISPSPIPAICGPPHSPRLFDLWVKLNWVYPRQRRSGRRQLSFDPSDYTGIFLFLIIKLGAAHRAFMLLFCMDSYLGRRDGIKHNVFVVYSHQCGSLLWYRMSLLSDRRSPYVLHI